MDSKDYKDENVHLMLGDCLERMKDMKEGCVDLTVTSPPYDNLRTYKDSLDWNEDVWKAVLKDLYRVTKEGGVVVWVVGDATVKGSETGTSFKQALYAMECGFNLHDTMIYKKLEGEPEAATCVTGKTLNTCLCLVRADQKASISFATRKIQKLAATIAG